MASPILFDLSTIYVTRTIGDKTTIVLSVLTDEELLEHHQTLDMNRDPDECLRDAHLAEFSWRINHEPNPARPISIDLTMEEETEVAWNGAPDSYSYYKDCGCCRVWFQGPCPNK